MKRIEDKPYAGLQWILLCEVICYFIISKFQISTFNSILILLIIGIVYFFSLIPTHYYFEFDNINIKIKNTWNLFFLRKYKLQNIDRIEIINAAYMGIGVKFHLYNGEKKVYNINNTRSKLEEMISDIERIKKEMKK